MLPKKSRRLSESSGIVEGTINLRQLSALDGGEKGIRTPGALLPFGFQDRRNRPLCHLSDEDSTSSLLPTIGQQVRHGLQHLLIGVGESAN